MREKTAKRSKRREIRENNNPTQHNDRTTQKEQSRTEQERREESTAQNRQNRTEENRQSKAKQNRKHTNKTREENEQTPPPITIRFSSLSLKTQSNKTNNPQKTLLFDCLPIREKGKKEEQKREQETKQKKK